MKKLIWAVGLLLGASLMAQRPDEATIRQWQSRKYGMFIHFGLFSELGGVWQGKQYSGNYSEQIESDAHIPKAEYEAMAASLQSGALGPGCGGATGDRRRHEVHCDHVQASRWVQHVRHAAIFVQHRGWHAV